MFSKVFIRDFKEKKKQLFMNNSSIRRRTDKFQIPVKCIVILVFFADTL